MISKLIFTILVSLSTLGLWQFAERLKIIPPAISFVEGSYLGEQLK